MTTDNIVIKAQGLTRRFGKATAVNQLNLSIPAQTIYGFLGPNGCGKSTTIRMLTGLLTPSEGSATVQRLELPRQAEQLRQHIGYMTQKFSLYDDLTVLENLTFVSQIYGLNQKALTSRIQEQLSVYSLEKLNRQMAGSLSGGQKQRLALAAATLHKPEILFLDEPTSAVDPENRRDFWEKLFDLCDQGTTIMVSTHYMDEAERCHGLAILENGEKRADGSPEQLMDNMQATVVEIAGENLRSLKNQLLTLPDVISAAQQGVRLRVLVKNTTDNAVVYLQRALPQTLNMAMNITHPSLEDVFVQCTGKTT